VEKLNYSLEVEGMKFQESIKEHEEEVAKIR
jgi:hypothetical protein